MNAYKIDKPHPVAKAPNSAKTLILYAKIGTKSFARFHEAIMELHAQHGSFNYILRHNSERTRNRVALSGYGVELDIKSTEYKAKDDSKINAKEGDVAESAVNEDESTQGFKFHKLKQLHPDLGKELDEFHKHLDESQLEVAPLKAWQMQDLSMQAAQLILDATEPREQLRHLIDLAQNFPLRAQNLSKIRVKKDFKTQLQANRRHFESSLNKEAGGDGVLYINGLELNIDSIDIFALNTLLAKEAKILESLHKIGLSLDQINNLVYLDMGSKTLDYGVDIRDSSIQWMNDLESDKKYAYWGKSLTDLLRPTYPGMLRSIARNFYNLVFVVDPAREDTRALLKTAESFYVNELPLRVGFVFVTNGEETVDGYKDASVALFRAHNYVKAQSGAVKALAFLTDVYARAPKKGPLDADFVVAEFKRLYPREKMLDDIFGVDSDYDEGRKLSMHYFNKIGLKKLPQVLLNGYPLADGELDSDTFEDAVLSKIMNLTPDIQMAIYRVFLT